jgi:hypothetical protein
MSVKVRFFGGSAALLGSEVSGGRNFPGLGTAKSILLRRHALPLYGLVQLAQDIDYADEQSENRHCDEHAEDLRLSAKKRTNQVMVTNPYACDIWIWLDFSLLLSPNRIESGVGAIRKCKFAVDLHVVLRFTDRD